MEGIQPILLLDAAHIHIHREVLEEAMKLKLWMCCVPACTTWLLQPLDMHCLAQYQRYLRHAWRRLLQAGPVSFEAWVKLLGVASNSFINGRRWDRAFEANGLLGDRSNLSNALKERLVGMPVAPSDTLLAPTLQQVALVLPKSAKDH